MHITEILNQGCAEPEKSFLVIGGFAVNAYGYSRVTIDLDILVSKEFREYWKSLILQNGYTLLNEHENFLQFTAKPPQMPLDVMLVNEKTFSTMRGDAVDGLLEKSKVKHPSLKHLIALKLHVLKQSLPHREFKDLHDILQLVHINKVNTVSDEFKELCERFGNLKLYETIRRESW